MHAEKTKLVFCLLFLAEECTVITFLSLLTTVSPMTTPTVHAVKTTLEN